MAREFEGDALKIRTASANEVTRVLGTKLPATNSSERQAFEDLSLVLALIPDLAQWTRPEKEKAMQIIRAKSGADESQYARLLQAHAKLRGAIIKLGEPSQL
jgi:hypothetical protein